MLDYVYGHDQLVSQFVASLIPHCRRGFGPNVRAIGIIDDALGLIAGIVYYNYDPEAEVIEIAGAALPNENWLTRRTLRHMYEYPFLGCRCQMVVQRTPADDERLLYMLDRYGYKLHRMPRLFGRDRDGVICRLTYEDWIGNKFNKRLREHQIEEAA